MSQDQIEKQSNEESRRSGDRRKRNVPVANDKRSSERRGSPGVNGLLGDVIAED
jgi:hypothetical protein